MAGFKDIIGHEQLKRHFQDAISLGRLSHAYIFNGEAGMGKKMMAKAFALTLQCKLRHDEAEPCMECQSCKQFLSESQPDIKWISHEKPNTISVEDVREQLVNDICIKPYSSPYKIYIIDEAEKLNVQAQNAILKTLEAPPDYVIILLLTDNADGFLPTILSRCVRLNFNPIGNKLIKEFLMERLNVPDYEVEEVISFAGGNPGKAQSLVASDEFKEFKAEMLHLLKYMENMEINEIVLAVKSLSKYKFDMTDCIDFMLVWYRDVLLFKASKDMDELVFKSEYTVISRQAAKCSYNGLGEILIGMDKAKKRLNSNVNPDLAAELMFLTIRDHIS